MLYLIGIHTSNLYKLKNKNTCTNNIEGRIIVNNLAICEIKKKKKQNAVLIIIY